MTDQTLVVNFGSLHHASDQLQAAVNKLTNGLGQLDQDALRLVNSWSGDAQQAYYIRQRAWKDASDHLCGILNEMRNQVDRAAEHYLETEQRNTNIFQS